MVFNLSSWTDPRQALLDWMAEELSAKYQVPKRMGRAWLVDNRLLLLLDGLDEVQAERRAAGVEAINTYVEEHGAPGLAVCSRLQDYTALPVRLRLYAAVCLQPLSSEQVTDYVARSGESLSGLAAALEQDPVLQTLAQTPLMLDVMTMAYRDVSVEALASEALGTEEARRGHLFETYIDRMFARKGQAAPPYGRGQTLGWLTWLAQGMERHGQTVFLIDQLQPSWLEGRRQRWVYALRSRLTEYLVVLPGVGVYALVTGLVNWLIGGLSVGLIDGSRFERSRLWAALKKAPPRWQLAINIFMVGLVAWLIFGLSAGLSLGLSSGLLLWLTLGLGSGVIGGLVWGTRGARQSLTSDIRTVESLSWSWAQAGKVGIVGLIFGLIIGLIAGLVRLPVEESVRASVEVSPVFDPGGLMKVVEDGLKEGLSEGLISRPISVLLMGLGNMLFYGVFGAIFGGPKSSLVEMKTVPNQGIKLSIRNAVGAGLLFGLIFWLLMGWRGGVGLGVVALLWFGGLDAIRHYTLRHLLSRKGHMPRRYVRFLNYGVRLIFLKRVGSGYIFIHRLFLEHFAARRETETQRL